MRGSHFATVPLVAAALTIMNLATLSLGAATADTEATNCEVREERFREPDWSCTRASRYGEGCIPAEAFEQWGCLELDVDARFCADESPFRVSVYLTTSNATLDCNGATIDHGWQPGKLRESAVRAPYTYSISNVAIRNCSIRDVGRYGIDLKRFFRGVELEGTMEGHSEILVENVDIVRCEQIGIYVGQNSRHVTVRHTRIDQAFMGIYLEAGSHQSLIQDVTITNSREREAIAIDSSQRNVIEASTFSGNAGGIQLYRNCGENYGQVCPIPREHGASYNTIRHNRFHGEGIHVASRQHRTHSEGWCRTLDASGHYRDLSEHNSIEGNVLEDAIVEIQGGPTMLRDNTFTGRSRVVIGAIPPEGAEAVPCETAIHENRFQAPSYLVRHGASRIDMRQNLFLR